MHQPLSLDSGLGIHPEHEECFYVYAENCRKGFIDGIETVLSSDGKKPQHLQRIYLGMMPCC